MSRCLILACAFLFTLTAHAGSGAVPVVNWPLRESRDLFEVRRERQAQNEARRQEESLAQAVRTARACCERVGGKAALESNYRHGIGRIIVLTRLADERICTVKWDDNGHESVTFD